MLQESFLFSGTIEENIRYGKPDASFEEVVEAAKMANAYEFIRELPNGFRTEVGENGVSLSGGQKQRLAIARTVLHNPAVLILDEATSALDPVTEEKIDRAIRRRGCACIVVAHRLSTIRDCDEIIMLENGKIVERGTHDELMAADGAYAVMMRLEQGGAA